MQDTPYPPRPLTEFELGWIVGLYEGEGCAHARTDIYGGAISRGVCVIIHMTDRDIIERVAALFPSGTKVATRNHPPPRKQSYQWRLSRRAHVAAFLQLLLPHLGDRRAERAKEVIAVATDPSGGLGSGQRNRTHCKNGHRYTPENTHINAAGHRRCRKCRRQREARDRLRQRPGPSR